ncbi:MAG: efflux RND transporter periplasmic adaptor subunit [Planctomycetota bacterium]|nr:efflux RND transporter periplasmic adaptor subunit [Planctomycetota bacterium]
MKKWLIVILLLLAIAGGGGWYWYKRQVAASQPAPDPTVVVERGAIRSIVASTGKITSNLDVDIKCKASGEIIKLPFDVSDAVKKGDLLTELDPVDEKRQVDLATASLSISQARLETAKQNLLIAEQNLSTSREKVASTVKSAQARAVDAQSKAQRMAQLLEKKLAAQEDYDTAQTSAVQAAGDLRSAQIAIDELKAQELSLELRRQDIKLAEAQVAADRITLSDATQRLTDTKVMAPMDGVIATRPVQIGQIIASGITNVGGGTTILTLSDLSRIFISATVDESDIGRVKLGQAVDITADAFRGTRFKGKVIRIATKGVNVSNIVTFEVKIEVTGENKDLLKPEMTTNVEIVVADKKDVLAVPVEAVVRRSGKQTVTLVKGLLETEEQRTIEVGINDGVRYEVTSGLEEGDKVKIRKAEADSKWKAGGNPPGNKAAEQRTRQNMMGGGGPPPPPGGARH